MTHRLLFLLSFLLSHSIAFLNHHLSSSHSIIRRRPLPAPSLGVKVGKSGAEMISTVDDFHLLVDGEDANTRALTTTLILYAAPWCGPCRLTSPIVKRIMNKFEGRLNVREVCTDDLPDLCDEEGIEEIPTVIIYQEGEVVEKVVGSVTEEVLVDLVERTLP